MKGVGFKKGADLLVQIAVEMEEWQKKNGPKNLTQGQAAAAKTQWTAMLDKLREEIGG